MDALARNLARRIGFADSMHLKFEGGTTRLGRRLSEEAGHRLPAERSLSTLLAQFKGARPRLGRAAAPCLGLCR